MALTLYLHPLASFCWKPLIALYEHGAAFTPIIVDLSDEESRNEFYKISRTGKFPVLYDDARKKYVFESTLIVEYVDQHQVGTPHLLPANGDASLDVRYWDRYFDFYVHIPMQKVVLDRLRPEPARDAFGVEEAKKIIQESYRTLNEHLAGRAWMAGDEFTLADCSAMPALYYAMRVSPLTDAHNHLASYAERLLARPSCARVLREAEPYFKFFPT